jgi:hypothetical protein
MKTNPHDLVYAGYTALTKREYSAVMILQCYEHINEVTIRDACENADQLILELNKENHK